MKIAMVASEVVPFAKTGGLADVVGALPLALERKNQDVIILMPFYNQAAPAKKHFESIAPDVLMSKTGSNVKVYLIRNDKYFNRQGLYGDKKGD